MVSFNTPKDPNSPYTPPNPEDHPETSDFERSSRTLFQRVQDGLGNAFFTMVLPTFLAGSVVKFLDANLAKATGQGIILFVLGLGLAVWCVLVWKRIRPNHYLPKIDFDQASRGS